MPQVSLLRPGILHANAGWVSAPPLPRPMLLSEHGVSDSPRAESDTIFKLSYLCNKVAIFPFSGPSGNGHPGEKYSMQGFLEALRIQRWDDHRYYHHSRINQSLHLVSALSFLTAYGLVFKNPAASALLGWLVAMVSRQAGHFFFEPKGYDQVNHATHEHKEDIKVGYNLRRKIVLLSIWALSPALLWLSPTLFGIYPAHSDRLTVIQHVGQIWLVVGFGALLFRTVQLFFIRDVRTGLVWMTKILTDPFHDFMLYYRAPLYLMAGQLIDPMDDVGEREPFLTVHDA